MARVALPKPEQITDPAVEGIFAWVTEMEGSVPNHFYCLLYTSPSPRDVEESRMPSSA